MKKLAILLRKDLLALEGREKTFLFAGLAGILLFAAILANTLLSRSAELGNEINVLRSDLAYSKGVLLRQEDFLNAYSKMKIELPSGRTRDESLSRLANEIEVLAKGENLTLNHIRPISGDGESRSQFLKIQAEIEGETDNALRFLHKVLSLPELLKAERFRLSQKSPSSMIIKAEFDLSLFQGAEK